MSSNNRICSALTLTMLFTSLALQASAETLFIDHFDSDGNVGARDRMPVRWTNGIAQDGDLVLSGTGTPGSRVRDLDIADVSVRTVFELVDGATIGIGARSGGTHGDFGYLSIDSVDGSLRAGITTSAPVCCTDLVDNVEVSFDPRQEDIAMQFDWFNDIIQLWVWPADETMPVKPLLEANATRLASGTVQLFVGGEDRREPNPQDVGTGRFRYVHVADSHIIPEPTTLLLAIVGMAGTCCYRHRHRR
jgi:hypothetical protein